MTMSDPFDLGRFLTAQEGKYETALREIKAGHKTSHWMWFVFPQFKGLGSSPMSAYFAIQSVEEARAYLAHKVLGARLIACAQAALDVEGKSAREIFGSPDDMKLRSCATLFAQVAEKGSVFEKLIEKYFAGEMDEKTLELMK
jgi:uncharacterized protein (DUF1810 family)